MQYLAGPKTCRCKYPGSLSSSRHFQPSRRLEYGIEYINKVHKAGKQLTEGQVDHNVVVVEMAPDVAVGVREVGLRLAPVVGVDSSRAALHVARDIGRGARPEPDLL